MTNVNIPSLIRKEGLRRGLSPRTIRTYCIGVEQFFRRCHKEPHCVTKKDIQDYLDRLLEHQAPGNTINVHLNALKFFYQQILHRRLTVKIRFHKTPQRLPAFLNQEEVCRLLSVIQNRKHRLIIALLYSAGLRVSEVLSLKVMDLQPSYGYGWVRRGKGNRDRPFLLAKQLLPDVQEWIQKQELEPDHYLFSGVHGKYTASSIREILRHAQRKAGLPHVHPHMLRHSFATHCLENGHTVTDVQPLLGHRKIETTLVYAHCAAPRLFAVESPYDLLPGVGKDEAENCPTGHALDNPNNP